MLVAKATTKPPPQPDRAGHCCALKTPENTEKLCSGSTAPPASDGSTHYISQAGISALCKAFRKHPNCVAMEGNTGDACARSSPRGWLKKNAVMLFLFPLSCSRLSVLDPEGSSEVGQPSPPAAQGLQRGQQPEERTVLQQQAHCSLHSPTASQCSRSRGCRHSSFQSERGPVDTDSSQSSQEAEGTCGIGPF